MKFIKVKERDDDITHIVVDHIVAISVYWELVGKEKLPLGRVHLVSGYTIDTQHPAEQLLEWLHESTV